MIGKHDHSCRQHVLNAKADSASDSNISSCKSTSFNNLITVTMLNKLSTDVQNLKKMTTLNVRLHEEEHVTASVTKDENMSDSMINLNRHQKRKLREKFRKKVGEGMPMCNTRVFKH